MNKKLIFRILGALSSALIIVSVFLPYMSNNGNSISIWETYKALDSLYLPIMIIVFGAIGVIFFSLNFKTEFAYMSAGAISFFVIMRTIDIINQEAFEYTSIGYYCLAIGAVFTGVMAFLANLKDKNNSQSMENVNNTQPSMLDQIDKLYNEQSSNEITPIQPINNIESIQPLNNVEPIGMNFNNMSNLEQTQIVDQYSNQNSVQYAEPQVQNTDVYNEYLVQNSVPNPAPVETYNTQPYQDLNNMMNNSMYTNQEFNVTQPVEQQVISQPSPAMETPINEAQYVNSPIVEPNNIQNVQPQAPVQQAVVTPNPVVQQFTNPASTQPVNNDAMDIFGQSINK